MSRLRVAVITHFSPHYRRPLFELLAQRLDATFYFFSRGEEPYRGWLRHEVGDFPVRDVRRITIAGHPLLVGLEQELSRERYDAVIKCINGRLMVPYVFLLARRRKLPFVLWTGIWRHPQTAAHRLTRRLTEGVYRGADAIVTYGDHVKGFVGSVPGVAMSKIYVAGQAIESSPFIRVRPQFGDPAEVLFVGRLEHCKGIADLLNAFRSVNEPRAVLRVAGTGPLDADIRGQARSDPRIEPLGHVEQADLPGELSRARCLVLPSVTTDRFREPWGLVVNEAMAAGVPVITTDAVGAAAGGLVEHGRNGLVVPERSPAALATAIARLVADPSLAQRLGSQARSDVRGFDYPRMVAAFSHAVDHAITASDRRP